MVKPTANGRMDDGRTHTQTQKDGFAVSSSSKVSQQNYIATQTCYNTDRMTKHNKSNRKAVNRNWNNQKANPALKTKAGNK